MDVAMLGTPFRRPGSSSPAAGGVGRQAPPDHAAPASPGGVGRRLTSRRFDLPIPIAIGIAAVVSGVLFIAVVQPLVGALLSTWCDDGLDALGCLIVTRMITVSGTYILAGLAAFPVLWILKVRRALPTALFGGAAMATGWTLARALAESTLSAALLAIAGYGIFFAIFHVLFTRLPGPFGVHLCAALAIVVVSFYGLTGLGEDVDYARFSRDVEREVARLDFDVYVPSRLPAGHQLRGGGHLVGMYSSDPRSYEVAIVNEMDRSVLLRSFRFDPSSFNPPTDCGPDEPGPAGAPQPCNLVGETPHHVEVYAAMDATSRQTVYYARVGRSVVTLRDANVMSPPSEELAMTVFGSLEKTSAARLTEMNDRVRSGD